MSLAIWSKPVFRQDVDLKRRMRSLLPHTCSIIAYNFTFVKYFLHIDKKQQKRAEYSALLIKCIFMLDGRNFARRGKPSEEYKGVVTYVEYDESMA